MQKEIENLENKVKDIQKELESLKSLAVDKPKFEVGKWYKSSNGLSCFKGGEFGYGFIDGKWFDNITMLIFSNWTLATESEVSEHLIEEAKRRGFKDKLELKVDFSPYIGDQFKDYMKCGDFQYLQEYDTLSCGGRIIFKKGKWAEIVKEEKILIGGKYEVKFEVNAVVINNVYYHKDYLLKVKEVLNTFQVASLNVGCNGQYQVDLEVINKILDKLK